MKTEISKLLSQQIVHEFASAYLYLDYSTFFAENGLHGFSHWFRIQAKEELTHGMRILDYLEESGEHAELCRPIEQKECREKKSTEGILKASLSHEQWITQQIEAIYGKAASSNDFRTMRFLDWFITEQAEEETNASDLIRVYERCEGSPAALFMMDRELGKRECGEPTDN